MKLNDFANQFDIESSKYLNGINDIPSVLIDAIKYSVLNGGKRLRPYMVYLGSLYGKLADNDMMQFAIAIELIHCYSLVHDDLPCMDNDTLRRGKPTTHIKYNEAIATLTGDALLNQAFEIMTSLSSKKKCYADASYYIAQKAGSRGMIAGQIMDMEERIGNADEVIRMYSFKTSALFKAALVSGAIASLADNRIIEHLEEYAYNLGIAFQIADDILDVISTQDELGKNTQSDIKKDKNTIIKIIGYDKALKLKESYEKKAKLAASKISHGKELIDLLDTLTNRKK